MKAMRLGVSPERRVGALRRVERHADLRRYFISEFRVKNGEYVCCTDPPMLERIGGPRAPRFRRAVY